MVSKPKNSLVLSMYEGWDKDKGNISLNKYTNSTKTMRIALHGNLHMSFIIAIVSLTCLTLVGLLWNDILRIIRNRKSHKKS